MPEQRIVLANTSRLLRDMLKRIIRRSTTLRLLGEITDQKELPFLLESGRPAWVIVSLAYDNSVPAWVDAYMTAHPFMRFMALSADGSKIKLKWLESHEQELNGLSLYDLLQILENQPSAP